MIKHYILVNGVPTIVSLDAWCAWLNDNDRERIVTQEMIGPSKVSTVFLGLDHRHCTPGPPILWETMTFNGKLDQEQCRCSGSLEQAEAMHEAMVKRVCGAEGIDYDINRKGKSTTGV